MVLWTDVDKAFDERNMGRVLVCAADAKQHATDILDSAYADATSWHWQFDLDESKEVLDGRTRQREELPGLFAAIQRGIAVGCALQSSEALKEIFTLGAWGVSLTVCAQGGTARS